MVFERAEQYPTREDYIDDCPVPLSAYGFSKLTGEIYCRAAHDEHGLPYTICRPFNAYGPGEMPDDEPGIAHAVPDLIRKSLARMRPLPIFGSGEQTRTLTHVTDIADGIVTAMAHPAGPQRGLQHLRRPRADGRRDRPHLLGGVAATTPTSSSSSTCRASRSTSSAAGRRVEKAERLLGWRAQIGVEEGIADTAEWLRLAGNGGAGG